MRSEEDFIGKIELPGSALYGINAWRASNNFSNQTLFSIEWYKAIGLVKQACYQTAIAFSNAARKKYPGKELPAGCDDIELLKQLELTAIEVSNGKYFDHFIVPALQGGAGTAINMNINEIIANATLVRSAAQPGDYKRTDPIKHANIFQSTNDVIPTALKVAVMKQLEKLEEEINSLRSEFEKHEKDNRSALRQSYTQMQEALPSSFGLLFSAYSDALSRDWWRVSKCFERIKVVNLGGGATGTGMAIPRYYIMEVPNRLRKITNLPLMRSDNHTDTTQNLDVLVEVHAILKAHAVNLEKIASDLQLLGSDIATQHEIEIPQKQTGSSIMPGKVNPVICEYVISTSNKIYSNDMLISNLCGKGCLELNAYLPLIGHALLESIDLLISANKNMNNHMIKELKINSQAAYNKILYSPSISTALIPLIGYDGAAKIANTMKSEKTDIYKANEKLQLIEKNVLHQTLLPENLLKLGYSLKDF